jgi:predicted PurR-regulated permease PerM/CheY-like chemotaxis protein
VSLHPNPKEPLDISLKSVLQIFLLMAGILVLFKVFTILLLLFLGSMLSVVLDPIRRRLEKLGLNRKSAITVIALSVLAFFISISVLLIPTIANQVVLLIGALPQIRTDLLSKIPDSMEFKNFLVELFYNPKLPDTSSIMDKGLGILSGAAETISAFALIWIFSVYLLADGKRAFQWFADFFSAPTRSKLNATAAETSVVISAYASGQFIMSVASTLFCYGLLSIFKVPAALTLATMAGLFDIIPIVGFALALAPAALLAYSVSSSTGLLVVVLYSAYHFLESYVIMPKIYGSRMNISGLAVILAILFAASIGGILLALAILPLVASYPIIERLWLIKYLGRDVVDRHANYSDDRDVPEQVKLWDVSRVDIQRSTTLSNKDISKHFRRRILIVEDDPDIRSTLQDVLETEGYHTFIASNGSEALTTLDAVPGIGLVLMDINMPVMDGKKLFEIMKLSPTLSKIPVVFLSGSTSDHDLAGAAGILRKPTRLEDVINTVENFYLRSNNGPLF